MPINFLKASERFAEPLFGTGANIICIYFFYIHRIKLFPRLGLKFSHLNKNDIKATAHYLLRCQLYSVHRMEVLNGVYKLDSALQNSSEKQLPTILLQGSENACFSKSIKKS